MIRLWCSGATVWRSLIWKLVFCCLRLPQNFWFSHTDMPIMIMMENEGDVATTTTTTCELQIDIIWRNFIFRNQNVKKKGSYYYVACHKTQFLLPSLLVQTVIYGILGIRLLEEFELVFRLKQVWKDSPRLSSSVRSIILQQNYLLIYEMWY